MRRPLLRYHLWLGWLVGVPLLLWTVSGLVMVARPIETVRGSDLRIEQPKTAIPLDVQPVLSFLNVDGPAVAEYRVAMRDGQELATVTYVDGSQALFNTRTGAKVSPIGEAAARAIVRQQISSATVPRTIPQRDTIVGARLFTADAAPFDFRKPMPVWQVRLADGTHVYVGRDTAEIEAVRTRYWRFYDFMWGLHIMDLQTREDTHHPILVVFAALAALATVLALLLMIARYAPERRRARE
jgi:hypothetical protein